MKKLIGHKSTVIDRDGEKKVFTVSFWIRNNEYKWSIRIPKIVRVKARKDGWEEIELPEPVWEKVEKEIIRSHSISEVRYFLQYSKDKIKWEKPEELEPKISITRVSSSTFAVGVSVNGFNTSWLPVLDEKNLRELGKEIFKTLAQAKEEE